MAAHAKASNPKRQRPVPVSGDRALLKNRWEESRWPVLIPRKSERANGASGELSRVSCPAGFTLSAALNGQPLAGCDFLSLERSCSESCFGRRALEPIRKAVRS